MRYSIPRCTCLVRRLHWRGRATNRAEHSEESNQVIINIIENPNQSNKVTVPTNTSPKQPDEVTVNANASPNQSDEITVNTNISPNQSKEVTVDANEYFSQPAADVVFAIPELLEKILKECSACDLLRCRAVCQIWRKTFDNSDTLLKYAQLISAAQDVKWIWWERIWDEALGLQVRFAWQDVPDRVARFELWFAFDVNVGAPTAMKITRQQRECYATQPPCVKMRVMLPCCTNADESIDQPGGIKMGHLFDMAERIDAEHQNCPEVIELYTGGKNICRYPKFVGHVKYPKQHPFSQHNVEFLKPRREILKEKQDGGWEPVWNAFKAAREAAETSNTTAPKWAVFLAENAHLLPADDQLSSLEAAAANRVRLPPINASGEITRLNEIENSMADAVANPNDDVIENSIENGIESSDEDRDNLNENDVTDQPVVTGDNEPSGINNSCSWWRRVGPKGRRLLKQGLCGMISQ